MATLSRVDADTGQHATSGTRANARTSQLLGQYRPSKQETLCTIAPDFAKKLQLVGVLDPFGHNRQTERTRHGDHGAQMAPSRRRASY